MHCSKFLPTDSLKNSQKILFHSINSLILAGKKIKILWISVVFVLLDKWFRLAEKTIGSLKQNLKNNDFTSCNIFKNQTFSSYSLSHTLRKKILESSTYHLVLDINWLYISIWLTTNQEPQVTSHAEPCRIFYQRARLDVAHDSSMSQIAYSDTIFRLLNSLGFLVTISLHKNI